MDFVAISKTFITASLKRTGFWGTNLQIITEPNGYLLLTADRTRHISVYDTIEAQNSFCQLAGQEGLKHNVLRRIRDFSHCLHAGDRVIIVFVGHGQKGSGNIILNSQRGLEYLTKAEVLASLYSLPPNMRVLLVSEACYSGSWTTITSDAGARRHGESQLLWKNTARLEKGLWPL